jgi:hypothetical protein
VRQDVNVASSIPLDVGHWALIQAPLISDVKHATQQVCNCETIFLGSHEIRTGEWARVAGGRTVQQTGGRQSHCSFVLLPAPASVSRPRTLKANGAATAIKKHRAPFSSCAFNTSHYTTLHYKALMAMLGSKPFTELVRHEETRDEVTGQLIYCLNNVAS